MEFATLPFDDWNTYPNFKWKVFESLLKSFKWDYEFEKILIISEKVAK